MGMTRYFEEFQVGERIISRSRTLEMADVFCLHQPVCPHPQ